jgi:PAS domain S-box-containing protein
MTGNASVRISQVLVGVVLAFMAAILYRTSTDTIAVRTANDTRALGSRVAQRESVRIDQAVGAIRSIKDALGYGPFDARRFVDAARSTMRANPMIDLVDYFDTAGRHVAHVEAEGRERFRPPPSGKPAAVPGQVVAAVEFVLTEAEVTRSTVSSRALRVRGSGEATDAPGHLYVYVAMPIVQKLDVVGTIVGGVDIETLLVSDLRAVMPPARYVLDDGSGRLETGSPGGVSKSETYAQTFSIPFSDRAWSLTIAPPPADQPAKPWLFGLLWLVAWLAVCVPIEVVGQISRRVQTLNEGLEASVASRTKQLQASVAELRTLALVVESVHEGVMLVDADLTIRYANNALCRELGCSQKDLVGRRVYDYAPLALSRLQWEELGEAVQSRGYAYLETERTRADGARYWAGITLTRYAEGQAEGVGLIAVSRDVSDRRRLLDELLVAKSELERQMRVRADFIGTASHELRTPATTLRTLSALLGGKVLPRYPFAEEDAKLLGMLDFETRRLANLVDDLLEVAKVDATEAALTESEVDLCAIARAEVEGTFGLDAKTAPPVELRFPRGPAVVRADENALRRIIVNLVGNARKFTPADGRVTLTIERVGDRVRLIVADTGIGIPEGDLPHVFERFYRVERPGTEIRGTGLGLAIVARLIERMHGAISISSEMGSGTTVSVEMPAAQRRAAAGD